MRKSADRSQQPAQFQLPLALASGQRHVTLPGFSPICAKARWNICFKYSAKAGSLMPPQPPAKAGGN